MKQAKLFIDGQLADTDPDSFPTIEVNAKPLSKIVLLKKAVSHTMTIPATERNRAVLGLPEVLTSVERFNGQLHTARIEYKGCVMLEGVVKLVESTIGAKADSYRISIITGYESWVRRASDTSLRSLPVDFSGRITAQFVRQSWTWHKPVRFLPVQRDRFPVENPSGNIFPPAKLLSFEDYHPFLHVKSLIDIFFKEAGYKVESDFMNTELFRSLYMSGNYPSVQSSSAKARSDFKAGRTNTAEATADSNGRVYANPYVNYSTLGNLVQTTDPALGSGFYDNGDCLRMDGERVAFVPPFEMTVAFEYSLFYTTDYYMASREELRGFNRINLDENELRTHLLANRHTDRRDSIRTRFTYVVIVFGHNLGDSYQLLYDEVTDTAGTTVTRTYGTFATRTSTFTVNGTNPIKNPRLRIMRSGSSAYVEYVGDWAMYDGYVKERGTLEVEVKLRSAAERVSPSRPKYFDLIFFGGADPGMKFVLGKNTTVKPVFSDYPTEGSSVDFSTVAAHNIDCLQLIESVRDMFNLYFYTDALSGTVYIEPREQMLLGDVIVDWSDRIDLSKPMIVSEPSDDESHYATFEYAAGDGAVGRWNSANRETFGKWEVETGNAAAEKETSAYASPLFTASINSSGGYPDAPSASLVLTGDRESSSSESGEKLNFPPKIVRYCGLKALAGSERWGWPSNGKEYPLAAFHHPVSSGDGSFTLCFEDRDGQRGLNRFWVNTLSTYKYSKRLKLNLFLDPHEIQRILRPDKSAKDIRALYRLKIGAESSLYRLDQITYPISEKESAECVFVRYL